MEERKTALRSFCSYVSARSWIWSTTPRRRDEPRKTDKIFSWRPWAVITQGRGKGLKFRLKIARTLATIVVADLVKSCAPSPPRRRPHTHNGYGRVPARP